MKKILLFIICCLPAVALQAEETSTPSSHAASSALFQTEDTEAAQALEQIAKAADMLPSLEGYLNVQDCVRIALANNPQAVSARLAVQSAAVSLSNAKSALLPTASAQISTQANSAKSDGYDRYNTEGVSSLIGATLNISGLTDIGRTIRTQQLELQRAQLSLCQTENAITATVKSAYYALLAAQRAVNIRTQSRDLYQEQYERTKAFYDQGLRPKVDVTTAEVDLNNAILSLIRATNLVKTRTASLANAMGVTRETSFLLDDKSSEDLTENIDCSIFILFLFDSF